MPGYADTTRVKEKSAIGPSDIALTDRDSDSDTDSDDFDQLIGELNEQASDAVDNYCRRDFEHHQSYTETLDGNGRQSIRLTGYPVLSVSSVKVGGSALSTDDYRVKSDSPAFEGENAGILERKGAVWPEGWENLEVTYDWGYTSPPGDVVAVVEELIVAALTSYAQNQKSSPELASKSMDGYSVSFVDDGDSFDLTPEQQQRLDSHKRVVIE